MGDVNSGGIVIRRAVWTQKPPPGTDLDLSSPLCPDHCWAFLTAQGAPQCLSRRNRVKTSTTSVYSGSQTIVPGGKYGLSVRHGATSDHLRLIDAAAEVDSVIPTGNAGHTILLAYRKTDGTARAATAIGIDGTLSSSDSMLLCLPYSDGTAIWRWGSAGANDLIIASLTYGDDLWIASTGPRGMELWQNGVLRGSNANNPSRTATGAFTFGSPAGTPNWADLADTALVMTWRRQLPTAAIRTLSENPWLVFQRASTIYLTVPPSVGAVTRVAVARPEWTQKPPAETDLDRTHPLCPDHAWPFLSPQGTAQSLAKNAPLKAPATRGDIYGGSSKVVPGGRYGLSVRHAANGDLTRLTDLNAAEVDKVLGFAGGFTVLLAYKRAAGATGGPTWAINTGVGTSGVFLNLPHSDNILYWAYGTPQLTLSAAGITFGDDLWMATAGPRGMEIWQNGKLLTSNATNPTRTSTACDMILNAWGPTYNTQGDFSLVMTWRRQLTKAEVRLLSENPWRVFQRPRANWFSDTVLESIGFLTLSGREWREKPPPGTDLDRTHPFCPDHCWPFLSPQGTVQCVSRAAPIKTPTRGDVYAVSSKMTPGRKYGLSVRHANASDLLRFTAADGADVDRVVGTSGGHTLLMCSRKTDATLRNSAAFGTAGSAGSTWYGIHGLPWTDNILYWRYGGTVEGTNQLSVSAAAIPLGDDLWVCTTGPRGMEMWQNGILRASNAGNPTRSSNAGDALEWPAFGGVNSDFADVALVMTWRRQLPTAAIRALSINPWQVFAKPSLLVSRITTFAPSSGTVFVPRFPALILAF